MENLYILILSTNPLLKIVALFALLIIIKLFLKMLKIFLPYIIKTNKTRYNIQDIAALTCGLLFIIFCGVLFINDIKEFAIPFSVIGAGVAFALQEAIASMAGRIVIVTTGLYQVGDRIQIGDVQGDVINIGFMRTSLMEIGNWVKADQYSGRIIHLTNAIVLKDNVINYSGSFPFIWDEIVIPIRYGSDQDLARKILLTTSEKIVNTFKATAHEKWQDVKKEYMVETPSFDTVVTLVANDNWLEFTIRYVAPYNNRRSIKDKLFSHIVKACDDSKGKVEFASMTIEITNFPKVTVDMN